MQTVLELKRTTDQYKVIGISTCHIKQSDAERLRLLGEDADVTMIMSRESGAFLKLYPDEPGEPRVLETDYPGFSMWFYHVLSQVKLAGFEMVEFDNAATQYESLPAFDW